MIRYIIWRYRGSPTYTKITNTFLLQSFLAYVRASAAFLSVGDHSTVPLTRISCNTVFSKSQNARKAGTLCMLKSWLIIHFYAQTFHTLILPSWKKSWKEIQLSFIKPFLMIAKWQKNRIYYYIGKKKKLFAGNKNNI